jgi:hypothetical protein
VWPGAPAVTEYLFVVAPDVLQRVSENGAPNSRASYI